MNSESSQSSYQALLTENTKLKEELKELKKSINHNKIPPNVILHTKNDKKYYTNTEFPPPMYI